MRSRIRLGAGGRIAVVLVLVLLPSPSTDGSYVPSTIFLCSHSGGSVMSIPTTSPSFIASSFGKKYSHRIRLTTSPFTSRIP